MDARKMIALLVLIVFIEGAYLYGTSQKEMREYEVCAQEKSQYCTYDGVDVLSDLNALLWVRDNLPAGTGFMNWWDYGRELEAISNVRPLITSPSRPLLNTSADFMAANISEEEAVVDPDGIVRAVAVFMTIDDTKTALCLAENYGAEYVYLIAGDFFKYPSIYFTAREEKLIPESELYAINEMYEKESIKEIEKLQMEDNLAFEKSKESTYMRLYISGDYNIRYFNLVYSDNLSGAPFFSRVKIYSINTDAMPENCCYNSTCEIEGRRIALKAPSQMSLGYEDMRQEYSIRQTEKYTLGSISESELEYGWRAGQWIVFETPEGKSRVGNRVDVYDRDHVKERFDILKDERSNISNITFVSVPLIGDESVAFNITYTGAQVLCRIDFRKYDAIATVSVLGTEGTISLEDAIRYAGIVEERIG
ncbi:MAG: hypothetical protein KAT83_03415 [Candidatus Aenigmarchaeota archaeon]|nr:hypothetical protein [Candidatus Aenigmarchaeota archaeon]